MSQRPDQTNGSRKLLETWPDSSAANVDLVSLECRSNLSGSDTICNCRVDIKLNSTPQLQLQSVLGFWLIVFPSLWSIPSVTERQRQAGQDGTNDSSTHSGPYLSPTGVTRMKRAFECESRLLTGRICKVRGAASHRLPLPSPSARRRCFWFQLADAQQKEPCEEWRKDDALQARTVVTAQTLLSSKVCDLFLPLHFASDDQKASAPWQQPAFPTKAPSKVHSVRSHPLHVTLHNPT